MTEAGERLIEGTKQALETAKCKCAEHAKTARPGKWECLECGAVWHISADHE